MDFLFSRTKKIENEIDLFLKEISEASIHFKFAIEAYLKNDLKEFEYRLQEVRNKEHRADELKRDIETQMYEYTLIPESRGDVLSILENSDEVIDLIKNTLVDYSIESPIIAEEFHEKYKVLVSHALESVEFLIKAIRCFFNSINESNDYIDKVHFYETEADRIAEDLKRKVFKTEMDLAHKSHIRYFINKVDRIADYAENVSDRLMIFVIKRQI